MPDQQYDTDVDQGQAVQQPVVVPPGMATPWSAIDAAHQQLSAGQPVTALPKQPIDFSQQPHIARLQELDGHAKAAQLAAEQAGRDADMYEQMSRVARSTKDIEIARHSIDVMGLQRDIQNGVPIHEAVARHPMAFGSGFGTAFKDTAPFQAPQVITDPATKERAWMAGGHLTRIPTALTEMGTPQSADVDGTKMVQLAPNRWQQVRKQPEGKLTEIDRLRLGKLYSTRESINKDIGGASPEMQASSGWKSLHQGEINRLSEIEKGIAELETKYGVVPPAETDGKQKPVGVLGQGIKTDPARPKTKEEFDSIPSQAWFINPKDGKLMQKK